MIKDDFADTCDDKYLLKLMGAQATLLSMGRQNVLIIVIFTHINVGIGVSKNHNY